MLDGHHRAVYRQHSKLPESLRNREVYYVVQQIDAETYRVTSFIHRHPPDLELRGIFPIAADCRYFVAKGRDLSPLQGAPEKLRLCYGGYCVSEVTLRSAVPA